MPAKYEELMKWSERVPDYSGSSHYFKPTAGTHATRLIVDGNDLEFNGGSDLFFRTFVQHSYNKENGFDNFLCWNYLAEGGMEGILGYMIKNKLVKKSDFEKWEEFGCPGCNAINFLINDLKMDNSKVRNILKTQERCLINLYYCYRAHPPITKKTKKEELIEPGIYTWDIASFYVKKIIEAMTSDAAIMGLDDDEVMSLVSHDEGKFLVVKAKGEGIGKNRRDYDFEFKGTPGPIYYVEDGNKYAVDTEDENEWKVPQLCALEAKKFKGYQDSINCTVEAFGEDFFEGIGWEVPGNQPSDNPLDTNYDKGFSEKALAKPTKAGPKAEKKLNPNSPINLAQKAKSKPAPEPEPEEEEDSLEVEVEEEVEEAPVTTKKKTSFEEAVPASPEWEESKAKMNKAKEKAPAAKQQRKVTW